MSTLLQIIRYAQPKLLNIFAAAAFSIINKIFDIFPDLLVGIAIDIVVNQETSFLANLGIEDTSTQLILLGLVTILVYFFESITEFAYSMLWRNLAQNIQHKLRFDSYSHLQNLEMSFFEDKSTGNLLTILVDDINLLEQFFNDGASDIIQLFASTIIIGAVFFYISPTIALLSFSPLPFILLITFYFKNKLKARYFKVRENAGKLASRIANSITGIATIKSYTAEQYENSQLKSISNEYRLANKKAIILSSVFNPIVRVAIMIAYVITLVLGGLYVIQGKLAVGSYSVLVFLTQRLLWPFTDLGWLVDLYERAMTSGRRVLRLLTTPIVITGNNKVLNPDTLKGHIVFDKVSFTYPSGLLVFKDLSFEILPGQTVAFVGSTGSGKSTIVKLLLRFYDATTGTISIDGIPVNNYTLDSIRKSIGLVSQEVFLVPGSIKANIAYGTFDASFDKIIQAAKFAEAYDFIMQLPDKFDTLVGERGVRLSGGQRQRISIARAVLKNAPIFIFDEATSAVDNETERAIQQSLEKIEEDHTTIVIAHRLSTIRNADNIFVMDKGQIIESGTHDQLVALDGVYARLWKLQTGEID